MELKGRLAQAGVPNEHQVFYTKDALLNIKRAWDEAGTPEFAVMGIGEKPNPDISEVAARIIDLEFDGHVLSAIVEPHDMLPKGKELEGVVRRFASLHPELNLPHSIVTMAMAVTVTKDDYEEHSDGRIEIKSCMLVHIGLSLKDVEPYEAQSREPCDSEGGS